MRILSWLAVASVACGVGIAPVDAQTPTRPIRLVVLGDSLTSGFFIPTASAFPAVLERALRERGLPVVVADAAVAGDTAEDGLARLARDVPEGTDGVVLELGANDKLKARDPKVALAALDSILRQLDARHIPVLMAGIRFTDPAGAPYNPLYATLAKRHHVTYYPDIYEGLASESRFTILDGIHPSPDGVMVMVGGILPTAERFVKGPVESAIAR